MMTVASSSSSDYDSLATSKHLYTSPFLKSSSIYDNPLKQEELYDDAAETTHTKTVLIVLNRPIQTPPSPIFQKLWSLSSFHICADGGANRLYDATRTTTIHPKVYIPDMIQGDLDSVREDTRAYYTNHGVRIQRDESQESHDLDKALQSILTILSEESKDASSCHVYVYGAFGGRMDHEMAALNALYRWGSIFNNQIYLYDDETCAFLLPAGVRNEIHLVNYGDHQDGTSVMQTGEGPNCGIIPLGECCKWIQTRGLKWDLDGTRSTSFGCLLSTSNKVMSSIVTIETSSSVIFTAEMKSIVESDD
jgi:thiamine pyrophosphokinase